MVLYTIMHHFCSAIQWWCFQDPNQGPKIQSPFRRRIFQLISLAIHGSNQKTIQGSQSPGAAGVGLAIHSWLFQGPFSEYINYFNQFLRHQVFQYSLDNSIGPYRWQSINLYVLGPIGPIHIPLWEFSHTAQISRWPDLYWPNSDNTAGDSPSRISLSTFHIYWPPFSTWGLFPQLINILDLFLS